MVLYYNFFAPILQRDLSLELAVAVSSSVNLDTYPEVAGLIERVTEVPSDPHQYVSRTPIDHVVEPGLTSNCTTRVSREKGGTSNTKPTKKKKGKKGRLSSLLFGFEDNQTVSVETPETSLAGETTETSLAGETTNFFKYIFLIAHVITYVYPLFP